MTAVDRVDPQQHRTAKVRSTVEIVETVGHEIIVHVRVADSLLIARLGPRTQPAFGESLELVVDCSALHLFDRESGQRLGPDGRTAA